MEVLQKIRDVKNISYDESAFLTDEEILELELGQSKACAASSSKGELSRSNSGKAVRDFYNITLSEVSNLTEEEILEIENGNHLIGRIFSSS